MLGGFTQIQSKFLLTELFVESVYFAQAQDIIDMPITKLYRAILFKSFDRAEKDAGLPSIQESAFEYQNCVSL